MVALLRQAEIRIAEKRIAAAAREYKEEKFEFMLVECDGEKLYKLVSENEIDNTISGIAIFFKIGHYFTNIGIKMREYHKQRATVLPSRSVNERPNPFSVGIMEDKEDDEICLIPIRSILDLDNSVQLLPQIIRSVKDLILATPDMTIRQLAVHIIDMIMT
ncbi:unnamed protein product [Strongylus vulgaris]|uniref:Uncharacterized protein n=1 Tax=Strongylus vulgaris TaxID=40348 RepID=A0A3P7JJC3_STRVU|nr:unnamed protein product [Strongylus vulgaris]